MHERHAHGRGKRHDDIDGIAAVGVAHDKVLRGHEMSELIHAGKEQRAHKAGADYAYIFFHARKAPDDF